MGLIETVQRVLCAGPRLRLAVLFGSQATGRAHANSDVDIAILPHDAELSLGVEVDLAARLSAELGRDVDIVQLQNASTLLRWEIARDGVLVFAKSGEEWVRFRAGAASDHADIRDSLDHAARLFRRRIMQPA